MEWTELLSFLLLVSEASWSPYSSDSYVHTDSETCPNSFLQRPNQGKIHSTVTKIFWCKGRHCMRCVLDTLDNGCPTFWGLLGPYWVKRNCIGPHIYNMLMYIKNKRPLTFYDLVGSYCKLSKVVCTACGAQLGHTCLRCCSIKGTYESWKYFLPSHFIMSFPTSSTSSSEIIGFCFNKLSMV